jgi:hypothetical protein
LPRNLWVPVYTVGIFGAFLQVAGGTWDVAWHALERVDSFFALNHIPLYAGVGLSLLAAFFGLILQRRGGPTGEVPPRLATGLRVGLLGGVVQVIAGGFDGWWHTNFGFDPFLFTPSHSLLVVGIVLSTLGMAIGAARLLRLHESAPQLLGALASRRWLQVLVIVALTNLWLALNATVYLLADVDGMAYTFRLGQTFVAQTTLPAVVAAVTALGITGTIVFFAAKSLLEFRGGVSIMAALAAAVLGVANLAFRALATTNPADAARFGGFIPLYLTFLIPVFAFDFFTKDTSPKRVKILGAALVGPFASYLDGWYGLALWTQVEVLVPWLLVPTMLAGLVGVLARSRLTTVLTAESVAASPRPR